MATAGFRTFGATHIFTMAFTLALPTLLAVVARRAASEAVATAIGYLLAGTLLINEAAHWAYRLTEFGLSSFVQNHLPLHACSVAVFATAAALLFRNQMAYEIAYFWGLVGSSNAVITPGLEEGFPEYLFFQYFISHSGIVVGVLFATWGRKMKPTLGGLFRAFVCLNVFAAGLAVFNFFLGSNYMYLFGPPSGTVTPFFFAPWPWYIPILEVIALAMFFGVLSPFLVARWWPIQGSAGLPRGTGDRAFSSMEEHPPDY